MNTGVWERLGECGVKRMLVEGQRGKGKACQVSVSSRRVGDECVSVLESAYSAPGLVDRSKK